MISGVKTLGNGDVGLRGRVPMAGAYRQPIGRIVGQAHLGAHEGSASAIRAGLMLPLLRGAGVGAMRQVIPGAQRLPTLRGGLRGGLGDIDMCTDPGWVFMHSAMGAAGAAMSAGGAQGDGDAGWAAAGGVTAGVSAAWAATCTAEARRRAQEAAAATDPTQVDTLMRELELERMRREAEGDAYTRFASTQSAPPATGQIPNWVYYAGAAAGLGLVAYAVLGKKRRR